MKAILPHLKGKSHIIWDWNGTLLDDVDFVVEVVGKILDEHDMPRITRENYLEVFCFPVSEYYKRIGFDFEKHSFEKLSEKFVTGYKAGLKGTQLHQGVKDLLHNLKLNKVSHSMLSATQQDYLHEQLEHFGIRHFFDHIYGLSNYHAKGKVERGLELIKDTGIPKDKTILVGDTDHDLEVGKEMGIEVLLLGDGHQSYERLCALHSKVLKCR